MRVCLVVLYADQGCGTNPGLLSKLNLGERPQGPPVPYVVPYLNHCRHVIDNFLHMSSFYTLTVHYTSQKRL